MIWRVALLLLWASGAEASGVVSLNLCTDQYLVLLAPGRIAALSPLARDPSLSVVAAEAARLPWVRADAEAVLSLQPDLVLAAAWGAQPTLAALEARGVRVVRGALPEDFAGIRAETTRMAALLGVEARGAALLAQMDAVLAGIPARARGPALALAPRGYTAGSGSLAGSVLAAAGFTNAGDGRRQDLETLLTHPPALLVVSAAPDFPSLATDFLRHPALRPLPTLRIPPALLACGGPWTADAAVLLAG